LTGTSSQITAILLGTNGELYSGLKGGLIGIWDLELSKIKNNLIGHSTVITALHLAKVNEQPYILVSGALDGKIKIWDLRNKPGNCINLKGHMECIRSLSVSPDNNYIASGSEDSLVRLWDIRQNKLLKEFSLPDQTGVNCVEFNPHSITLAYGSNDRTVKHWDLERYDLISITPLDRLPITKVKFDSSGKNAYVATNETLKYWMIDDSKPELLENIDAGWNKLQDMVYVNNEGLFAVSTYGSKLAFWSVPESSKMVNEAKKISEDMLYKQESVFARNGKNVY
jgi:WD40 repeat protein